MTRQEILAAIDTLPDIEVARIVKDARNLGDRRKRRKIRRLRSWVGQTVCGTVEGERIEGKLSSLRCSFAYIVSSDDRIKWVDPMSVELLMADVMKRVEE